MVVFQLDAASGYEPRPDYVLRIYDDGGVNYIGRYYVGILGKKSGSVADQTLNAIYLLANELLKRNQKNYLRKEMNPVFTVFLGSRNKHRFEIDKNDVISEDIISQIVELSGAAKWIYAQLDLFLLISRSNIRSRELALIRAAGKDEVISLYLNSRENPKYKSAADYLMIKMGVQIPDTVANPGIYFSYSEYQIIEQPRILLLNQGLQFEGHGHNVYLYITFGKRYNDPSASYFVVLAHDKIKASQIFSETYPHFMANDFQKVDLGVLYTPVPFFTTQIPIAVR